MIVTTIEDKILESVKRLSLEDQRRVLDYVKSLERPEGTPGPLAIQYADEIHFPPEDLAEIKAALQDFEEIDLSEWDLPS